MEEILSVKNLKKYFTKKGSLGKERETIRVADGVSFSINSGETVVLAGESGSGKTTIARLILRAIEPDSGIINFNGEEISNQQDQ
jgi:peptide/nickel transport system ATP-binding protein